MEANLSLGLSDIDFWVGVDFVGSVKESVACDSLQRLLQIRRSGRKN
jgi:hypothetical protein